MCTESEDINKNYENYQEKQAALAELFDDSSRVVADLHMAQAAEGLQELGNKVQNDTFKVQIVGSFSNGKSSLINAMLGGEYLPAYALPCTAIINEIKYAETRKALLYFADPLPAEIPQSISPDARAHMEAYGWKNVPPMEIPFEEIEDYTCVPIGDDLTETIMTSPYEKIELYWPLDILKNGVEIIDSPGLNDDRTRTSITKDYLKKADAIIFVMSADKVCAANEIAFIENSLKEYGFEDIFFVVNKFDLVREKEREMMRRYVRSKVAGYTNLGENGIFFLSALEALDGKMDPDKEKGGKLYQQSGMYAFEKALSEFLTKDRGRVKLTQPARELKRVLISEAGEKVIPQQKVMLRESLEEVRRKYQLIEPKLEKLRQKKDQMAKTMELKIDSVMYEISRLVTRNYADLKDSLPVWLEEYQPSKKIGLVPTKKTVAPVMAEMSKYLNGRLDEEQRKWQDEKLKPMISEQVMYVFGSVESDLGSMFAEIDSINFEISGEAPIEEVLPWERVAGMLGNLSDLKFSPEEGISSITKNISTSAAIEIGAAVALAVLVIANPISLVGIAVAAVLGGGFASEERVLKKIKDTVLKEANKEFEISEEKQVTGAIRAIQEQFMATAKGISDSVEAEIDQEDQQLKQVIREMEKGESNLEEKKRQLVECEAKIKELGARVDDFVYGLLT